MHANDRGRVAAYVIGTAALFALLAYAGNELIPSQGRIAALWVPNAVLAGILLRTQNNSCPLFVAACLVSNVAVNITLGDSVSAAILLAVANSVEVVVFVAVMRNLFGRNPTIDDIRTLGGILGVCIAAPLVSGILPAVGSQSQSVFDFHIYHIWVVSNSLSLMIITPLILVAFDSWKNQKLPTKTEIVDWIAIGAISVLVTSYIFSQIQYPLLFLVGPVVILAAFRTGMAGTALSISIIATVAASATIMGSGPIMLVKGDVTAKVMVLQTFLATCFAVGLPVAAVLSGRQKLQHALVEARSFTDMMLDNVQEVIFRTDASGRWNFLNPAWEAVTGYSVVESLGQSTKKLLHPDDRAASKQAYARIASGEVQQARLRQRFFTASGDCRRIEVLVRRLVNDEGQFVGTTGSIRDITESVGRERALAESEARFRYMAEAAPVGIFRADAEGQVTYVNRAWCQKVGMTVEESLGTGWMNALADRDDLRDEPAFSGYKQPGDTRRRTLRLRRTDGSDLWTEAVSAAEFDSEGKLCGFVGVVIDITDQRQTIEALRESERRFQTLANLAPAGIFRTDADGKCSYVNDAWLALTGFTDNGWMDDGWAKALHPEDKHRIFAAWASSVADRRDFREEWRWVRPDGSISWVDSLGRPEIDEAGRIVGFVGVNIDITQRREAEIRLAERDAQLSLLANNATDAVFRIGLDGRCIYASPSVAKVFGVKPEAMVGKQMLSRLHPEDCATVTSAFLSLTSGASSETIITYRSEAAGQPGIYRWLEANCGLVRSADGQPSEVIASLRDVSRKKLLETELRAARANAEAATAAKASFLANMSHEIRTPMNGVLGFTELLANSALDEEQSRYVQVIADSGRAMMRLLNDILDISKIESGQMQVTAEPMDLRHKLSNCVKLMQPVAIGKGLALNFDVHPEVPAYILSDAMRVRQIVMNLVGNAIKFTEHGSVSVQVHAENRGDQQELLIVVEDTGIGISADRLSMIFQQFSQADVTIARRFGGTGLGLAISSELAQLMGGSIEVESELGTGSKFTVRLPLIASEAQQAVRGAEPIEEAADLDQYSGLRVLVAEDHDINQMLMRELGRNAGLAIDIASNGEEAITMVEAAHAANEPYGLVLMDMQMPVVDGLEATRRLRALGFDPQQLPIVALTANAYHDDITACRAAGMQAHLSKPVSSRDIATVIRRFVTGNAVKPSQPDRPSASTPAAAETKSLKDLYQDRRAATLNALSEAVRKDECNGTTIEQLIDLLHKLAGTAGYFGEAGLGSLAASLEEELSHAAPDALPRILREGWSRFSAAA